LYQGIAHLHAVIMVVVMAEDMVMEEVEEDNLLAN
jgi:hypothetical protein